MAMLRTIFWGSAAPVRNFLAALWCICIYCEEGGAQYGRLMWKDSQIITSEMIKNKQVAQWICQ